MLFNFFKLSSSERTLLLLKWGGRVILKRGLLQRHSIRISRTLKYISLVELKRLILDGKCVPEKVRKRKIIYKFKA